VKREKYSIFGREPDTKKGCDVFIKKQKKTWGVYYSLNEDEIQHMKDLMRRYYYTPLKPAQHLVQGNWKKVEDQIKFIAIKYGPIYKEPRFEFYNEESKMWDFSVARCICLKGNGLIHESLPPKSAVIEALRNATAPDRLQWKKDQGYHASTHSTKDAHHVDGKEFKTIYLKFLSAVKMSDENFVSKIYPEHGDFKNAKIEYKTMIGWEFKDQEDDSKKAWVDFHNRNREYELIDPVKHRSITSEETKFNTNIRNLLK